MRPRACWGPSTCTGVGALVLLATCSPFAADSALPPADASTADASTADASTADGASTGADGSSPGCAGNQHWFCDDFDRGDDYARWDTKLVASPGSLDLVQGGVSSPYALEARFDGTSGAYGGPLLRKTIGVPTLRSLKCGARVYVDTIAAGGESPVVFLLGVLGAGSSWELQVRLRSYDTALALLQDGSSGVYPSGAVLPARTWLELDVSLEVDTGAVVLGLNGKPHVTTKFETPPTKARDGAIFELGVFRTTGGNHGVRFDDAFCDTVTD